MNHRPSLVLLAPLALIAGLTGCSEGDKPTPPAVSTSRNEAVTAASGKPATSAATSGGASAAPKGPPQNSSQKKWPDCCWAAFAITAKPMEWRCSSPS